MPNIEIHGLSTVASRAIRSQIVRALKGASYGKDIVITEESGCAFDLQGNERPFLRLIGTVTDVQTFHTIEKRLASVIKNMDIQEVVIERVIPAQQLKNATALE